MHVGTLRGIDGLEVTQYGHDILNKSVVYSPLTIYIIPYHTMTNEGSSSKKEVQLFGSDLQMRAQCAL